MKNLSIFTLNILWFGVFVYFVGWKEWDPISLAVPILFHWEFHWESDEHEDEEEEKKGEV